jgi:uncharacterized membrane protein YjjP (DUF1212 family)
LKGVCFCFCSFAQNAKAKFGKMEITSKADIQKLGSLILQIGSLMQSNGASTARIRITLDRLAQAYGFNPEIFITHRALNLTLLDDKQKPVFNSVKRTEPGGVNFKIITGISRMSLKISEKIWPLEDIIKELEFLIALPHYPRLLLLVAVGLADAGFCRLADGNLMAMAVAFIATIAGLYIRQEATKKRFNMYLVVLFASFTATMVAGVFRKFLPGFQLEQGFATSVLFLIPGVPLLNSFTDIIDGNLLNGVIRLVNGLVISLMIALGFILSMLIYNF